MDGARWALLNALARRLGARRYLEIGVASGECFNRIEVADKTSVDPARNEATVRLTSDEFFRRLGPSDRFDLVFVDGLHERRQVHRDILNAWRHLTPNGAILVHDCSPPTEASASPRASGLWCGDVYRGWMDARHDLTGEASLACVETDLGCGLVVGACDALAPVPPPWPREETDLAGWEFFAQHRAAWLNSISTADFYALVERLPTITR